MHKYRLCACIGAFLLVLTACGGQSTQAAAKLQLQLSWVHEYSSAMFYAAEKNGHFAKQNLQVTLAEGGFKDNTYIEPIDEVVNGTGDFGMTNASSLILARSQGKPVVAIASILQRSPYALISFAEKNINRPQDLTGHKVAVSEGGATQAYNTLLGLQNIDPKSVNTVPRTSFGIEPLLNGDVDAMGGWIINEGVQVEESGHKPKYILMTDYGVETYDFVIFTTEKTVKERPEVVERFLRAVFDGMKDVVANPEQAAKYTIEYAPKLDLAGQRRRLEAVIPLMNPPGTNLGSMNPDSWKNIYQILVDQKALEKPVDVTTVYTMAFLDKIYPK